VSLAIIVYREEVTHEDGCVPPTEGKVTD